MTDLIARLEVAPADEEHIHLYDVLTLTLARGWISEQQYDKAMVMRSAGAYLCAAMVLVPEGWLGTVSFGHAGFSLEMQQEEAELWNGEFGPECREAAGKAATPALALSAAALKAQGHE